METQQLDQWTRECEATARKQGWDGEWTLQVGDLDWIVSQLGRKLTAVEGEYLDIPRWAGRHVDWQGDDDARA